MSNGNPAAAPARRAADAADAAVAARALRRDALAAWRLPDPAAKAAAASALGLRARALLGGAGEPGPAAAVGGGDGPAARAGDDERPGRPARPRLVSPRALAQRPVGTPQGRIALLHAVAHIELNAIDLALDAAWRFDAMPDAFLGDWLAVAADEARHYGLLADELARRGAAYGDLDAHDGLWRMAELTRDDPLARMALVPGVLEARGLDATPPMQARLAAAGDARAAAILQVILDDEIGHVAAGRRWFRWLCAARGLEPRATFESLARRFGAPRPKGPLNVAARRAAGWDDAEIAAWASSG